MRHIILSLLSGLLLGLTSSAWAELGPGFEIKDINGTKIIRQEDGSRSIFERNKQGIRKSIYSAEGKLMSVTLYNIGKHDKLRSSLTYDGNNNELFLINYDYNENGRLVEEHKRSILLISEIKYFL